ncbi:MAG TPA: heptaprenyl diphosphate synthase, partial [Dehalococcoidia bacterium]|nr:heptaprenyl diphosphate synthase [Dehalococcoidia bacterium]
MRIATIYQPVREDLAEVEKQFKLIVENQRAPFPEFHEMLSHVLVGGKVIRPALTL